mmetsp:Transcript_28246/g.34508  ORF Transcript_28246/g.34508 Transcript_28246/m.34508 type:complete len:249 (+) Transcript_28246:68-814(+)
MDEQCITDIFKRFDRNHDGIITREELVSLFEKLMPDFKDVDRLLQQMDTNHDGKIQYEEFVVWIMGTGKDRARLLHAHADAAHKKVDRLRDSQLGMKRTEMFWSHLDSEKGRESLASLCKDPPRGALAVCAAVHNLLRTCGKKIHWETAQKMMEDTDVFLAELKAYNPYTVPAYVVQSFEQTLTLPYFDYDRMVDRNYAMACLGSWVIAAVRGWKEAKQMVPIEAAALRADAAAEAAEDKLWEEKWDR